MHHKRKRSTTRRELRRLDSKSYRQQERRVMDAPESKTGSARVHRWGYRPEPLPLNDLPCTGTVQGKKKARPKKAKITKKCARHEWYHETVVEDHYYTRCTKPVCDNQRAKWARYPWSYYACSGCWDHKTMTIGGETYPVSTKHWAEKVWYKVTKEQATCINCWEVRVYHISDPTKDGQSMYSWRGRKRLKHRTQDPVSGMTISVK